MKEIFKKKCEELFKSYKGIRWFDKEGIQDINENFFISFRLDDIGSKDYFNGFHVDIHNKKTGCVKQKFFWFRDYFQLRSMTFFEKNKLEWQRSINSDYLPEPTSLEIKAYVDEIKQYIKLTM